MDSNRLANGERRFGSGALGLRWCQGCRAYVAVRDLASHGCAIGRAGPAWATGRVAGASRASEVAELVYVPDGDAT